MKTIPITVDIEGLDGNLELVEPTVNQMRPIMAKEDSEGMAYDVLAISLHRDGEPIQDLYDSIGMSAMNQLMPIVTEMMGWGDDEGND